MEQVSDKPYLSFTTTLCSQKIYFFVLSRSTESNNTFKFWTVFFTVTYADSVNKPSFAILEKLNCRMEWPLVPRFRKMLLHLLLPPLQSSFHSLAFLAHLYILLILSQPYKLRKKSFNSFVELKNESLSWLKHRRIMYECIVSTQDCQE